MAAMKAANKDLKGTMKTLKIDDIDVCTCLLASPNLVSLVGRNYLSASKLSLKPQTVRYC
jgi:hypothetical protein